ncbi:MAG TPA: hypothetical protein VLS48_07165 [Anaerolineales bacterium]|nr:hypothetical protein [Anaerolineales bacterium]
MKKSMSRFLLLLFLFAGVALACQTVNQASEQIEEAQGTVQAIATSVEQGSELLATMEGVATQAIGNPVVQTAQAVATEQGAALVQTLQAAATNELPGIEATLEAFATREGPALQGTAEALLTAGPPGLAATAQAIATDVAQMEPGDGPANVPTMPGEVNILLATEDTLSYTTPSAYTSVVEFYKSEMPLLGWTPQENGNVEMPALTTLQYANDLQTASVTITPIALDNTVAVLLVVRPK